MVQRISSEKSKHRECANHCYLPTKGTDSSETMEQPEPTNVVIFWGGQPYCWLTQQKKDGCVAAIDCSMAPYVSWCKQCCDHRNLEKPGEHTDGAGRAEPPELFCRNVANGAWWWDNYSISWAMSKGTVLGLQRTLTGLTQRQVGHPTVEAPGGYARVVRQCPHDRWPIWFAASQSGAETFCQLDWICRSMQLKLFFFISFCLWWKLLIISCYCLHQPL